MLIANYINVTSNAYRFIALFLISPARADGKLGSCTTVMAPIMCFLIPTRGIPKRYAPSPGDSRVSRDKTPSSISERKGVRGYKCYYAKALRRSPPVRWLPFRSPHASRPPTSDRFSCGCDVSRRKIR